MSNLRTRTTTKRMSRPNMNKAMNRIADEISALVVSSGVPCDDPRVLDATQQTTNLLTTIFSLWRK